MFLSIFGISLLVAIASSAPSLSGANGSAQNRLLKKVLELNDRINQNIVGIERQVSMISQRIESDKIDFSDHPYVVYAEKRFKKGNPVQNECLKKISNEIKNINNQITSEWKDKMQNYITDVKMSLKLLKEPKIDFERQMKTCKLDVNICSINEDLIELIGSEAKTTDEMVTNFRADYERHDLIVRRHGPKLVLSNVIPIIADCIEN